MTLESGKPPQWTKYVPVLGFFHLLVTLTQRQKGTHKFWHLQIVIFENFCVGK